VRTRSRAAWQFYDDDFDRYDDFDDRGSDHDNRVADNNYHDDAAARPISFGRYADCNR
jgi:hypothetical protein